MKPITFITGNKNKLAYLEELCDFDFHHRDIDLSEIQSLDLKEVVEHKAKLAYSIIKGPVLVEDVSLECTALKKLPGPFIKWFCNSIGNQGICDLVKDKKDKSAKAEVLYGLYNGKTLHTFSGVRYGTISKSPKGKNGFGWDPIFIPKGHTKTFGEMEPKEKTAAATRVLALKKLKKFLHHNEKL